MKYPQTQKNAQPTKCQRSLPIQKEGRFLMTERQYLQHQINQLKITHNNVVHEITQQRNEDGSNCLDQV